MTKVVVINLASGKTTEREMSPEEVTELAWVRQEVASQPVRKTSDEIIAELMDRIKVLEDVVLDRRVVKP